MEAPRFAMPSRNPSPSGAARLPLLPLLITVTLLTLAVALWYLTSYSLRDEDAVRWMPPATAACDPSVAPCTARLDGGAELSLAIRAEGAIRPLERLPLEVRVSGTEAEAVRIDFVGREMDMGLHRFPLEAEGDGVFRGTGQVSLCTEAVMPWRAKVVVDTPRGRLGSWFDFEVQRR